MPKEKNKVYVLLPAKLEGDTLTWEQPNLNDEVEVIVKNETR